MDSLSLVLSGALSKKRAVLTAEYKAEGARVISGVSKKTTHLVTTDDEVASETAKVVKARQLGIPMVSEAFVDACIEEGEVVDVAEYLLEGQVTESKSKSKGKRKAAASSAAPASKRSKKTAAPASSGDSGLESLSIVLSGALSKKRGPLTAEYKAAGVRVVTAVSKKTTHLVTTDDEVASETAKVLKAQQLGIPMVSEAFVDACIEEGEVVDVAEYLLESSEGETKTESKTKSKGKRKAASSSAAPASKRSKKTAASAAPAGDGLESLSIVLSGALSKKRGPLTAEYKAAGVRVVTGVSKKTTHLVTTDDEVASETAKVVKAQQLGIPMVSEAFVDACIEEGEVVDVAEYLLEE